MRRVAIGIALGFAGLVAAMALALALFLTLAIPLDLSTFTGTIESAATEALDRRVRIEGPVTLVPSLEPTVQVERLRIANPESWPAGDLITLGLARAQLAVLPLLRGRIEIAEIAVDGLAVDLAIDDDGEANWLLGRPPEDEGEDHRGRPLELIELRDLSLRDLVVSYRDVTRGTDQVIRIDEVTGSALDRQPLELSARGSTNDIPYELALTGGSLATLAAGAEPWSLDLRFTSPDASFALRGAIEDPRDRRGIDLTFDLQGGELEALDRVTETRLPPIDGYRFAGRVEEDEGGLHLRRFEGRLGDIEFGGDFAFDLSGQRPAFGGQLDIPTIDLRPFLRTLQGAGRDDVPTATKEASASPASETAPRERGAFTSKAAFDLDQPIFVFDVLEAFDADFQLTVDRVIGDNIEIRDASLQVAVENGALSAPTALVLAEVPFAGVLDLVPTGADKGVSLSLRAEGSDIGDLAKLISGRDDIEGRFEGAELTASVHGETLRELLETLDIRFSLRGGALSYGNEEGGRPVGFTLDEAELILPAGGRIRFDAEGSLLDVPLSVRMTAGDAVSATHLEKPWPLQLTASGWGGELLVSGTSHRVDDRRVARVDFDLSGERIGEVAAWLGISPDADLAYRIGGGAELGAEGLRVGLAEARIGATSLSGELGVRAADGTPLAFASLAFETLDLAELERSFAIGDEHVAPQAVGDSPEEVEVTGDGAEADGGAAIIDVPILPHGISLHDADLELRIARLELPAAVITDLSVAPRIRDGRVGDSPFEASFAGASFTGDLSLDLRGQVAEMGFAVAATEVDIGRFLSELALADGLEASAGRIDLDLAITGRDLRDVLQKSRVSGAIRDAVWTVRDPNTGGWLEVGIPQGRLQVSPGEAITLALDGRIDGIPVAIEIRTEPLLALAVGDTLSLELAAELLDARLDLAATTSLPIQRDQLSFQVTLTGERLDALDPLLDVALPPFGPYSLGGQFEVDPDGYRVDGLNLGVGDSDLQGEVVLATTGGRPRLDVALTTRRLQLDDFRVGGWSAIGADVEGAPAGSEEEEAVMSAAGAESVTPPAEGVPARVDERVDALLSPEVLRSGDGRLVVTVEEVVSGQDHLGSGEVTVTVQSGQVTVAPLLVEVAGGSVDLSLALTPGEAGVLFEAGAKIEQFDYGVLARRMDPTSAVGGQINVDMALDSEAPNLAAVMAHANGHLDVGIWPKDLNAGIFDLWAVSLLTAVLPTLGGGSRVNCVVGRFGLDDGIMEPEALLVDSTRVQATGVGRVDFREETVDLLLAPRAKRPQVFNAATPIRVRGRFDQFGIGVGAGALVGTVVRFVTSVVVAPFQWVFGESVAADGEAACAEAWGRPSG